MQSPIAWMRGSQYMFRSNVLIWELDGRWYDKSLKNVVIKCVRLFGSFFCREDPQLQYSYLNIKITMRQFISLSALVAVFLRYGLHHSCTSFLFASKCHPAPSPIHKYSLTQGPNVHATLQQLGQRTNDAHHLSPRSLASFQCAFS